MNDSKVLLRVENFRAISQAQIKLDGITVVTGVNGCGKSTISKLLYWIYRGATNFKVLANTQLKKELDRIRPVVNFVFNLGHIQLREKLFDIKSEKETNQIPSSLVEIISLSNEWDEKYNNLNADDIAKIINKLRFILEKHNIIFSYENAPDYFWNILNDVYKDNENLLKSIIDKYETRRLKQKNIFDVLLLLINEIFNGYKKNLKEKPRLFLDKKIREIFHENKLPKLLEISEDKLPIFKTDYDYLSEPYWIDNVIYIDTPMFFQNSGTEHWEDVNEKLKIRPEFYKTKSTVAQIDELIKKEVLTGQAEIKFDELSRTFIFKTPSGVDIDLSDSATGIKAFAVLNLLVKNKSINDKTLLILDEPEAHLHPQWVIEFGRLLTLIHKHIGAKIFVATHSPDMVQALRYIPNKEDIGDKVNFYLAKADDDKNGQFIYQDLKGEIDDIFKSFNIAIDKLGKYGED